MDDVPPQFYDSTVLHFNHKAHQGLHKVHIESVL